MSDVTTTEREALAKTIRENRTWWKRMGDGYTSVGSATDEEIADAILAAFDVSRKDLPSWD